MWGDIAIHYDTDLNTEYLEYNERQTKTRTGVDLNNIRKERPRLYATGTDTCPVGVYKIYASHRPDLFSGITSISDDIRKSLIVSFYYKCHLNYKKLFFIKSKIRNHKKTKTKKRLEINCGFKESCVS